MRDQIRRTCLPSGYRRGIFELVWPIYTRVNRPHRLQPGDLFERSSAILSLSLFAGERYSIIAMPTRTRRMDFDFAKASRKGYNGFINAHLSLSLSPSFSLSLSFSNRVSQTTWELSLPPPPICLLSTFFQQQRSRATRSLDVDVFGRLRNYHAPLSTRRNCKRMTSFFIKLPITPRWPVSDIKA